MESNDIGADKYGRTKSGITDEEEARVTMKGWQSFQQYAIARLDPIVTYISHVGISVFHHLHQQSVAIPSDTGEESPSHLATHSELLLTVAS